MRFSFRAADAGGRTVRGVEDAPNANSVERSLAQRGLFPLDVTPAPQSTLHGQRQNRWVSRRADVAEALATLSALLEAGLTLERGLEITCEGAARGDVAGALEGARAAVRGGGRLADAVQARRDIFPPVAAGLIAAGERGGHLADAVRRLAETLERETRLRSRVTTALTYPALLAVVGVFATTILLAFVLPQFATLLADSGTALPPSTAFMLGVSHAVVRYWPPMLLVPVAMAIAVWRARGTLEGRERTDGWLLRLPMIGGLRSRYAAGQVAHTLGTLLAGGTPLLPALDVAADTVPDSAVAADLRSARASVRRGESLSGALERGRRFPHLFIRLVRAGEESGEMDAMLFRAAALMEAELERRLARTVSLLEPLLILFFGFVIGGVALALFQAIYGIHADAF